MSGGAGRHRHSARSDAGHAFNDTAVTNDWAFAIVGPGGKSGNAQLDTTVGAYPIAFSTATNSPVVKGDKPYAFGYPAAGRSTATADTA